MLNLIQVIGRLGDDPIIRYTADKKPIANLSVATTETWKDKDRKKQEFTEWHKVVCFGKLAEICGEYLKKGQLVYFQGSMKTRKYQKDGMDHYAAEIHASEIKMLGGKGGNGAAEKPSSAQSFDDGPFF